MLNCLMNGSRICSFDVKNEHGLYIFEEVEKLKEASSHRKLLCDDCRSPVFLKTGEHRVPHFAHFSKSSNCYYEQHVKETEEHRQGKSIFYSYFKRNYPSADVQINYRQPNGRRTDVFVSFDDGKLLAIEFQRNDLSVVDWKAKQKDYLQTGINALWVLSAKEYSLKNDWKTNIRFFEELLAKKSLNKQTYFLDTETNKFIVAGLIEIKKAGIVINKKVFYKEYNIDQILILPSGELECDFNSVFQEESNRVENEIRKVEENLKKQRESISFSPSPRSGKTSLTESRYGKCEKCGIETNDWSFYDPVTKTCLCTACSRIKR